MPITAKRPFKGRQHPGELIILCVRWYLRYPLSYEHVKPACEPDNRQMFAGEDPPQSVSLNFLRRRAGESGAATRTIAKGFTS